MILCTRTISDAEFRCKYYIVCDYVNRILPRYIIMNELLIVFRTKESKLPCRLVTYNEKVTKYENTS